MVLRAFVVLALTSFASSAAGQSAAVDPTAALVLRLEQAGAAGDAAAVRALAAGPAVPGLDSFASSLQAPATRFIIKERDRAAIADSTERLLLEIFSQYGDESAITTWRMDVAQGSGSGERRIAELEQLTVVSGLYRLALNPAKHFDVRNLVVRATDLTLELPSGHAFVAETAEGPTAIVLLGRGRMRFNPSSRAEQTQVRIFGGGAELAADFDAAFVRVRPAEFDRTFAAAALLPRAVGQSEFRRASDVFDDYVGQTLQLDLTDLSRDRWSLLPAVGDLIAEVRTRRLGSLTYARSTKDPEDITLFDRKRRRNIAVYASKEKLAARGRFYSEDELVEYDVQHYDVDAAFTPDRAWVAGTTRVRLKIRSFILSALTFRLAEPLVVRSVVSSDLGRLLHLRVVGQNSVIVNFPGGVTRGTELSLTIAYAGRLEPQHIDRESIAVSAQAQEDIYVPIEPQYLYSNRSYWYPQATVTDYATARLRLTVPADLDVVASGSPAGPPAAEPGGVAPGQRARKLFVFDAERPVRYLSCIISRFTRMPSRALDVQTPARRLTADTGPPAEIPLRRDNAVTAAGAADATFEAPDAGGQESAAVTLNVQANPRQSSRARSLSERTASIFEYYAGLLGSAPFPSFTLAITEHELPGGHSPAYFALLNTPPPLTPLVWRNDPVAFDSYPHFFLAHEIAHQWWGQAVGWKNYHEQWLSEGFAQYFAALYAGRDRGDDVFVGLLRQMRRWAIDQSEQGPVYLGYRLGHIKAEGRVFRALFYNKGAMVLHMLRRLVGDEAFFAGIRQFYTEWKFRKAGTDDFRAAIEKVSGRNLDAFFDAWIYGANVPSLRFTSSVTGAEAQLRFEHRGDVIPVPVTVSVTYADGRSEEMVVAVTERVVERTLTLSGPVRSIDVNRDHGAVADIAR